MYVLYIIFFTYLMLLYIYFCKVRTLLVPVCESICKSLWCAIVCDCSWTLCNNNVFLCLVLGTVIISFLLESLIKCLFSIFLTKNKYCLKCCSETYF